MVNLGISEGFHDAGVTVLDGQEIKYASHSERYSRKKGDKWIHPKQMKIGYHNIAYYEKPFWKNTRRFYANQSLQWPRRKYDYYFKHHQSHAAAGYFTAPFHNCNIIVVDAIGEWDTVSIWDNMKKIKSFKYPYSLGLLYSAITHRLGLKPNEDEYITMGMAAYGEPKYDLEYLLQKNNHWGVGNLLPNARDEDLAASIQNLYESKLLELLKYTTKNNLILMGGCALNCVANSKIPDRYNIWIMPSPGDAGSSLGAAALINKVRLNWKHPYLGHNIDRTINPKEVVRHLLEHKYCGIANGRAEFGPRALGNRSLIADPRYPIKDTINQIKRRQKYRPFAPMILEEHFDKYFKGRKNRYMQFVSKALHDYKSVTHVDGTARVQVVERSNPSVARLILEEWYEKTGCPMLLNTSLNIKGQPIVNTWDDAIDFQKEYNVKVF
jgi:carbamoyltransferase